MDEVEVEVFHSELFISPSAMATEAKNRRTYCRELLTLVLMPFPFIPLLSPSSVSSDLREGWKDAPLGCNPHVLA